MIDRTPPPRRKSIAETILPNAPRELTVREIELVLESLGKQEIHPIETICPEEPIPAVAVALSTGPTVTSIEELQPRLDALKDLLPSQVPELLKQVREKNSFLAQAVENLSAAARQLQNHDREPASTTSEDPSVG